MSAASSRNLLRGPTSHVLCPPARRRSSEMLQVSEMLWYFWINGDVVSKVWPPSRACEPNMTQVTRRLFILSSVIKSINIYGSCARLRLKQKL